MDIVWEGEGGGKGAKHVHVHVHATRTEACTLPRVEQTASGNSLYDAASSSLVLCDDLQGRGGVRSGREVREGGDMCVPMADSRGCMGETNMILYSNFPLIKNKLLKKEKSQTSHGTEGSAGSAGKESANNAGDPGSVSGSGRSRGGGNGNPLQHSCLENPMDRGAWWATVHRVAKSRI